MASPNNRTRTMRRASARPAIGCTAIAMRRIPRRHGLGSFAAVANIRAWRRDHANAAKIARDLMLDRGAAPDHTADDGGQIVVRVGAVGMTDTLAAILIT